MANALWLLLLQGVIGAFDTFYFHEWRARLPARGKAVAVELKIHAARDFLYGVLFCSLPWIAWRGWWAVPLAIVILAEALLTYADFVVEITARKSFGDVFAFERVTHNVMAVIYGAMLVYLVPTVWGWWNSPTALSYEPVAIGALARLALTVMGIGIVLSGIRDLAAALGFRGSEWPWKTLTASARQVP